jgi:hypothetical protein
MRTLIIPQAYLLKRAVQLGETNNYCQIAVRPANTALGKGANTVLIGSTFLQDYYLFFLVNDISNTVGVAEANP